MYRDDTLPVTTTDPTQTRRRRLFALLAILPAGLIIVTLVLVIRGFAVAPAAPGTANAAALDHRALEDVLGRARQHLNQSEVGRAEALLREAVERSPDNRDLRALYGETLLLLGRPREAYAQYEHAVHGSTNDSASLRSAAGDVASLAGLHDRAEEHYWRAQQLEPSNPKHPLYLAQIQRKLGKADEAKASLLRAAKLDPSLAVAWASLASVALDENKLSIAQGYIKRAREAEPERVAWRLIEAKILRRENRPEDALRLLAALSPEEKLGDPAVVQEMGLSYGLLGRPADAAALYAEAAERPGAAVGLVYETALWYERAGELDVAAAYAGRAARMGSEPAKALAERLAGASRRVE